ncbi:unnamed protein product, partial [Urochloa humidicola]
EPRRWRWEAPPQCELALASAAAGAVRGAAPVRAEPDGLRRPPPSGRRSSDADEDLRELIRAASQRRAAEAAAERHPAVVPRSHSLATARIDEDAPCEFGGSAVAVFPRSRSYAVGAGRRGSVTALALVVSVFI